MLPVRVNGLLLEIELNGGFLQREFEYDISKHLQKGENEITFYPPGNGREIKAFVDLSREIKDECAE